MSLRLKVFLTVGGTLAILFFGVYNLLSRILIEDFFALERQEVQENALRVADGFQAKTEELSLKVSDWGQWDDTFAFVQDHNQDWVDSNTQNEAFTILGINLMLVADNAQETVFKKAVGDDGSDQEFPGSFEGYLAAHPELFRHESSESGYHGVARLPEGLVIFASRAITSSDGAALPQGTILFGYFLDQDLVAKLADVTHLELYFIPEEKFSSERVPSSVQEALARGDSSFIPAVSEGDTYAEAYVPIRDIDKSLIGIFRMRLDRHVFAAGQETIALVSKIILFLGAFFIAVISLVLERLVIRRISSLKDEIERVSTADALDARLSVSGTDEFAQLGSGVNAMLEKLQEVEAKKKESEERFQTIADIAPVMILILDKKGNCEYMNKPFLEFLGDTSEERIGKTLDDVMHPDDVARVREMYLEGARKQIPHIDVEFRLRRADGAYRWIAGRATPNLDPNGVLLGYVGSSIDITDRKEAESSQQEHVKEIETMNKMMVSRELKMVELKREIARLKGEASE